MSPTRKGFLDYEEFEAKFKKQPVKTTDDCYTPPKVFSAVQAWVHKKYGTEGRPIVRPFKPGGSYEDEEYPEGCLVLDNPPFSILSKIVRFYQERGVDFFLFCPGLACSSAVGPVDGITTIVCNTTVVYHNGARVNTGFVTNLSRGKPLIETAPDLHDILKAVQDCGEKKKKTRTIQWPRNLVTVGMLTKVVNAGVYVKIDDGLFVRHLESKTGGNADTSIFGGGYLLTDNQAERLQNAFREAALCREKRGDVVRLALTRREVELVRLKFGRDSVSDEAMSIADDNGSGDADLFEGIGGRE